VFSFGVVLLELTTGKRANEGDEYESLSDWALRLYLEHGMLMDMIDEGIRNDAYIPDIITVFELGLTCTTKDPITRPTMKWVLQRLIECDRTNNTRNAFTYYDQYDEAPLILSKKGSRRKDLSHDFHEDDDDSSGSFEVHVS
jgi:kinase